MRNVIVGSIKWSQLPATTRAYTLKKGRTIWRFMAQ
jgi:hypothetical protein